MENEIITDWLDKCGDSESYKKVEDYIEKRYESDVISSDCLCYRDDEGMIVLCDKCLKELTGIN